MYLLIFSIFLKEPFISEGMSLVVDFVQTGSKGAGLFGPIAFLSFRGSYSQGDSGAGGWQSQGTSKNKLLRALLGYLGLKH